MGVIALRAFGRLGQFLATGGSRVGSVGGVVDRRAQPGERLRRATLVGVGSDHGGVELEEHPVDCRHQRGVQLPQSMPDTRVADQYAFERVAAASQRFQRARQRGVFLLGRAIDAATCAPAERSEHRGHVSHEHRGAAPHVSA